jgi:hypothetical protein
MPKICAHCQSKFESYKSYYRCHNCDDGICECTRDIDFNGTGYCKCYVCGGSGEINYIETTFCCDDCAMDHENENSTFYNE